MLLRDDSVKYETQWWGKTKSIINIISGKDPLRSTRVIIQIVNNQMGGIGGYLVVISSGPTLPQTPKNMAFCLCLARFLLRRTITWKLWPALWQLDTSCRRLRINSPFFRGEEEGPLTQVTMEDASSRGRGSGRTHTEQVKWGFSFPAHPFLCTNVGPAGGCVCGWFSARHSQ